MPLKNWILHRMNRMNGVVGRPDLPRPHARSSRRDDTEPREPSLREGADLREAATPGREDLGIYAPLIAAVRDELEHFAQSALRLHLAIAERDRYLLTSIDVECVDGGDGADLLRRFAREFTPEQIKRFLARDVIGHLPNASAIDLSQFGGLNAARTQLDSDGDEDYAELLAELRATTRSEQPRAFDVTLLGRWVETDAQSGQIRPSQAPRTPLAGNRIEIDVEDADGMRRVALPAALPNRRYVIGKDEGCDVAVNGTFASRRHCEIWLDNGSWWATDADSTNGIRVESASGVLGRAGGQSTAAGAKTPIEIVPGARIVLSAVAQGRPAEFPRILLRQSETRAALLNPSAKPSTTPVTPIAAPMRRRAELSLTASMASGSHTVAIGDRTAPICVGRSRNQDLVVDWAHQGVSGHHVDITSFDEEGADVEVLGDNGVSVDGVRHPAGHRFRWRVGERMTLGRPAESEPACTLTLVKSA
jgi:hypothetical protein